MAKITVVGVGPGHRDYLTKAGMDAVAKAQVLVGGSRQMELFADSSAEKFVLTKELDLVMQVIRDKALANQQIVVLASGDPGFYGILATLKRYLPDLHVHVIPGISSIQLVCARLGMTWDDACLTSCHGRNCDGVFKAVQANQKVIILTDAKKNPVVIARQLQDAGIEDRPVTVACNLSLPNESILETTLAKLSAAPKWCEYNCVMVVKSVQ